MISEKDKEIFKNGTFKEKNDLLMDNFDSDEWIDAAFKFNQELINKEKTIVIPEELKQQAKDVGILDDFNKVVEKLQKGELTGDPMDLEPCEKIVCSDCGDKNTSWVLDKNSDEVYYNCNKCGDNGGMHLKEYEVMKAEFPEHVIKDDGDEEKCVKKK